MNHTDIVWSLANEFVDGAKLVTISAAAISRVAKDVVRWKETTERPLWNFPTCIKSGDIRKIFLYELIANSVNYCFWYGRHNIRPNGASSTKMYNLLDESFEYPHNLKIYADYHPHNELKIIIGAFIEGLSRARFPLIDHRVRHLNEILNKFDLLSVIEYSVSKEDYSVDRWLDYLITSFPGYSKDLFLKRAFLFIMQMYRRCGIFGKEISKVLVPADYQIPKMLRGLGCISYKNTLDRVVDGGFPIADGCWAECEIRSATIVTCRRIADLARCTCEEVDSFLFGRRHYCTDAFHLTITTNY